MVESLFRFQSLTQRRSEHDATLIPQAVQAAFDVERRVFADVTVVGFAIVADVFDDFCAKVRANPQLVRAVRFKAEQAANVRVAAGEGEGQPRQQRIGVAVEFFPVDAAEAG